MIRFLGISQQFLVLISTATAIFAVEGCQIAGWADYVLSGPNRQIEVDAEYRGLENQTAAVMVMVDDYTLYRHPDAATLVAKAVGGRIAESVPTATLVDPQQIEQFVHDNPYWSTQPYGQLMGRLEVDRMVLIDLVDFSTQDAGKRHMWQGTILGNINVVERHSTNPEAFVFSNTVRAKYPPRPVALLDSDEPTIQLGLLKVFSERVVSLFYDHKEAR